jgi:hypothetical protein
MSAIMLNWSNERYYYLRGLWYPREW